MRLRPITAALLAVAALTAACSQKARNESSEAANAIAADVNVTAAQAVGDTTNALDAAGNATGNGLDAAGNAAENAGDATANAADNAAAAMHNKE